MSMWEIEALIEDSINLVGETEGTNEEKIQQIGNLYAIQEKYDCSFTNFRVMPVLLKTGYTKTIEYTEYPDYKGNEDYFEKLARTDDIVFIYRDITKEWSEENKRVAYWENVTRKIYIDYDSPLRKGEPLLEVMNVYDLGLYLIREAHKQQNKGFVYEWTAFLIMQGPHFLDKNATAEEIINRYLEEIKKIWSGYDYSDYDPLLIIMEPTSELLEWMGGVKGKLIRWFHGLPS